MSRKEVFGVIVHCGFVLRMLDGLALGQESVLPSGVKAVWDMSKAYHETTPTRERICINGLWRWQPAASVADQVPTEDWGHFKVPGAWTDGTQTIYPHPSWRDQDRGGVDMAWYQREIAIAEDWRDRRISVYTEYLNSYAAVYLDGEKTGEMYFPWGEVDITSACRPGGRQVLSLYTAAVPLAAVTEAFTDTGAPKPVKGTVERRGLCGDVFLVSTPKGARIGDVKVEMSVRNWEITFDAALQGLEPGKSYTLRAQVADEGRKVKDFASAPFNPANLKDYRLAFIAEWKPDKLWDVHTPQNMYDLRLSLLDSMGKVLDTYRPVRFGFREFWIEGRDFYLNGTRLHSSIVPIDDPTLGAAWATYEAARETMLRQKSFGVNTVFTHNYGTLPGSHLSFSEMLRAADDVGMLLALSQPHYRHYNWTAADAEKTNGYARLAEFYVRMAQNHPSVVMYSMNHNALAYGGSHNPDRIDGLHNTKGEIGPRTDPAGRLGCAQAIVERLDPTRVVYHHSSGNLGNMHTNNIYLNFVPIRERSDWFEHWATKGVKPLLLCEYGAPWAMTWTMYRGWYKGKRAWGSALLPYEVCDAEWNAQFLGDRAFKLSQAHQANLRWETKQFRAGREWHKWDYPFNPSAGQSLGQPNKDEVWAMYITDNWRAFRTWGVSSFNIGWAHGCFWRLRDGVNKGRKDFKVDWDDLQRSGFSPDHIEKPREYVDYGFDMSDWIPTAAAKALIGNNMPLLAYIGGKSARFTSKDHNFLAGQAVEKQLIIINNSRETVTCDCSWTLALPRAVDGNRKVVLETGKQERIPLRFVLPAGLDAGTYKLTATVRFSSGETQTDSFDIDVLAPMPSVTTAAKVALFDPKDDTGKLLGSMGLRYSTVAANANLDDYDTLIVGKGALTVDGPAPDIARVRDGLKVIMFEQTADVMEKRFGFRVQEYGLRRVFARVPDHPLLAGLATQNLHDWAGEATTMPPRLTNYDDSNVRYGPRIMWCGIKVTRAWRCGNWGNVASVLIEKPARGDFLPIADGGFSLQYSPLMVYREGSGMVLFCQMDVTGRSETDPAAERLVRNILNYTSAYAPPSVRKLAYVGEPAGRSHLESAGIAVGTYRDGKPGKDQALVVGPGGGRTLAADKDGIKNWVDEGGHLLAVGLGQDEANAFLPFSVKMRKAEHITTVFEPVGAGSPLAGIGPAEVHNRDPKQIELVSGGAEVVGNGVLATAENGRVVFCQLAPWQFEHRKYFNQKRTFRMTSLLVSRILGNMGVGSSTPVSARFSQPVGEEKRYLSGLYLDAPSEFDDPYRYFNW